MNRGTLFANALVCDGTGGEFNGSVLVADGRILEVSPGSDIAAAEKAEIRVVDCAGRILAPGFIDAHGHSDVSILSNPAGSGKIRQGITTEIAGNCGLSAFPITSGNRAHLNELYARWGVGVDFGDFTSYRRAAAAAMPEVLPLCGHNTLRAAAAGYELRAVTADELRRMQMLLSSCFDHRCPGLSLGLLYVPGVRASREELLALLRTVAKYDRILTVHLRSEGDRLLESLAEMIDLAQCSGLTRLHISHFKTSGAANWHKLPAALEMIDRARKNLKLTVDRYPYTESMTSLSVIVPDSFGVTDDSALQKRLRDPAERRRLAELLEESRSGRWASIRLIGTAFRGRTLPEEAAARRTPCGVLAAELLAENAVGQMAAFHGMSEENMLRILQLDYCVCGTDESAMRPDESQGSGHPRGFGAMPRFFRILRRAGMSYGEIVARMSGRTADIFQLSDRGVVRAGKRADLVLIDPERFTDCADFDAPNTPAAGVEVWSGAKRLEL